MTRPTHSELPILLRAEARSLAQVLHTSVSIDLETWCHWHGPGNQHETQSFQLWIASTYTRLRFAHFHELEAWCARKRLLFRKFSSNG